jgi:pyroglutamyl-peptidase
VVPEKFASRNSGRTTVLLTGFGPFPLMPMNATMELVPAIAERARSTFPGILFATEILPTEWVAAPARLVDVMRRVQPDVIIHFGVSPRARGFEIETRAFNSCGLTADAIGALPSHDQLDATGPDQLQTRLPAANIVKRLRRVGVPAFLSRDAGTYLCNAIMYASLDALRSQDVSEPNRAKHGFVHVPSTLVSIGGERTHPSTFRAQRVACPLTWAHAVMGGIEIVKASLGYPQSREPRVRNDSRSNIYYPQPQRRMTC